MRLAVTGPVYDVDRVMDDPFVLSSSKSDFLIVLGGCGITEPRARFDDVVRSFTDLPCGTLFLDAEGDDYDLLDEHPAYPWNGGLAQQVSRSVMRLCRGQVFNICGLRILTLGGRSTPGRDEAGRYWSWWPEQDPSVVDVYSSVRALDGLRADFVLSSDHPSSWGADSEATESEEVLEYLRTRISYDHWLFADGGVDRVLPEHDAVRLRDRVVRIA